MEKEKKKLRLDSGRVKELLAGRSQRWLADKIGESQQNVNYWLNSGSVAGVVLIAGAFGVDPKQLLIDGN